MNDILTLTESTFDGRKLDGFTLKIKYASTPCIIRKLYQIRELIMNTTKIST